MLLVSLSCLLLPLIFSKPCGIGLPDQGVNFQISEVFPKNWNSVKKGDGNSHACLGSMWVVLPAEAR